MSDPDAARSLVQGEFEHDRTNWNQALSTLPPGHVLQSFEWGETKAQTGWRPHRLLFRRADTGNPVAAASLLCRRLPRLPLAVAYVPKGPALAVTDTALVEQVLARIEQVAREQRAIFVKIDPDVRADTVEGAAFADLLRRRGYRFSPEQIQYRNTLVSDLTPDEDQLLAGMKSKTRYNIRLAARKGVSVRAGGADDLHRFYGMYEETSLRDGFIIRPFDYYRHTWETFIQAQMAHLLLAEVAGEIVSGLLLFRFGQTAWYMYGASTARHRRLMPNHLLQWEAMRWAKAQGCTTYDWWGAPNELHDSDPMWGVYRFKLGFGGEFVPHIGAWDYPLSRPLYWLYTVAMPRVLDLMRSRHRAEA